MKLTGILDNSLNGQLCIRGFANIKELARVSEADYSYQRGLLDRSDISDFLERQTYLFFPEVILSYKIKYAFVNSRNKMRKKQKNIDNSLDPEPLKLIQEGKNYKCNLLSDNTEIVVKKTTFRSGDDSSVVTVELILDDNINKPLHRIDGNHRLNAAEKSNSLKVDRMVVPFCILLGTEYYNENEQHIPTEDEKVFDKATKVFFHNINTKTIPLTSEENLKVMIDDKINFSNDELIDIFGDSYPVLTRELISKVNPEVFTGISHVLNKNYRTFYNSIFSRMLNAGIEKSSCVGLVLSSLQAINTLYANTASLQTNNSIGLLESLLWYHMLGNEQFVKYREWILSNHIFGVSREVSADSFIELFDNIHKQTSYKVFVAVPYISFKRVNEYNKLFKEVLSEISKKIGFGLELIPIMRFRGESQRIDQRLINCIKECDIFVGDLSTVNDNVIFEVGLAEGCGKKILLIKAEEDTDRILFDQATVLDRGKIVPFDMDKLQYIPYSNSGYYNDIKSIIRNNIPVIVEQLRNSSHV